MTPSSISRISVPNTETRIDPRQPRRFEKKNIMRGNDYPIDGDPTTDGLRVR